jgi:OOP family OmpA-OmpF porin
MKKTIFILAAISAGLVNAQTNDNWMASGSPVKNSTGLCWRNANWTPATAHPDCDGALKAVAPAPVSKVETAKPAAPVASAPTPVVKKVSYSADAFFDFDKSVLKPEGKQSLDKLASFISTINIEVVIAVGHTDSVGTDAYNQKLGYRRAEAVKAYLVSKGLDKNRVYTESKGEKQPVADNKTAQGRAKNRRVEIEVVGVTK